MVCHGTPPATYLKEHVSFVVPRLDKVGKISFRDQDGFFLKVYSMDGTLKYCSPAIEDTYYYAFLKGLTYRESCYSCRYASSRRCSDITLGDFWGLAPGALHGYEGRISLVLVNTDKGKNFFETNENQFVCERRALEEAIRGNDQLRHPSIPHSERKIFCEVYENLGSYEKAIAATSIPKTVYKYKIRNKIMYIPRKVKRIAIKRKRRNR